MRRRKWRWQTGKKERDWRRRPYLRRKINEYVEGSLKVTKMRRRKKRKQRDCAIKWRTLQILSIRRQFVILTQTGVPQSLY